MNEIVTIEPKPLDVYRMSTDAAGVCREIVVATASTIQGRKFVSVEGWQAIALAHGCVAGSRDVEWVEGGVRAIGEVRRMSDGQMIAQAEGFVGHDEPTWFGGVQKGKTLPRRADYAIRAMAQTRAISRACRSAFAHVVVMMKANLETTPAAEVPDGGFDQETGEIIERQKIPGITKIRERLNKLWTEGNAADTLRLFQSLVKANKNDLDAIWQANHELWTGDGADFEGYEKWIERRAAELAPKPEPSLSLSMLLSALAECNSRNDLNALLDEHGTVAEELDGEESRQWEAAFNAREEALLAIANVAAG